MYSDISSESSLEDGQQHQQQRQDGTYLEASYSDEEQGSITTYSDYIQYVAFDCHKCYSCKTRLTDKEKEKRKEGTEASICTNCDEKAPVVNMEGFKVMPLACGTYTEKMLKKKKKEEEEEEEEKKKRREEVDQTRFSLAQLKNFSGPVSVEALEDAGHNSMRRRQKKRYYGAIGRFVEKVRQCQ
jgi:hypothetical protein